MKLLRGGEVGLHVGQGRSGGWRGLFGGLGDAEGEACGGQVSFLRWAEEVVGA